MTNRRTLILSATAQEHFLSFSGIRKPLFHKNTEYHQLLFLILSGDSESIVYRRLSLWFSFGIRKRAHCLMSLSLAFINSLFQPIDKKESSQKVE